MNRDKPLNSISKSNTKCLLHAILERELLPAVDSYRMQPLILMLLCAGPRNPFAAGAEVLGYNPKDTSSL